MIFSKVCMFKDLEELQANGCQTDVCLVGAGSFQGNLFQSLAILPTN